MVPDHWSNDAMVSMDRCGLIVTKQFLNVHCLLNRLIAYIEVQKRVLLILFYLNNFILIISTSATRVVSLFTSAGKSK